MLVNVVQNAPKDYGVYVAYTTLIDVMVLNKKFKKNVLNYDGHISMKYKNQTLNVFKIKNR